MRSTIIIAGLAMGMAGAAQGQRAGSYSMDGVSTDGQAYSGSAILRSTGPETWEITFNTPGAEPLRAVGISRNGILSVGFTLDGAQGAAWYRLLPNGVLEGRWTAGLDGRVGTERLVPK